MQNWTQGAPLESVRKLCEYWRSSYDWRRCERLLNDLGQYRTPINGLDIHFLHIRSSNPRALPLLITHGWPGSVVEFLKIVGPLTEPQLHGGSIDDAFHIIAPSLPGFGFSGKPEERGWTVEKIAEAWAELMRRLGYDRFVAQGGDWGGAVTTQLGGTNAPGCAAIHLNAPIALPVADDMNDLTVEESASLAAMEEHNRTGSAYALLQATKPQTLGYGLVDSPIGQAAWIYEKFHAWSDHDGAVESILSYDDMLDAIMMYWLPATGASSARLYQESLGFFKNIRIDIPVGVTIFPKELFRPSRRWAERVYPNLIYWNEAARGGHFAAFEQPEIFVTEVRTCFRLIR